MQINSRERVFEVEGYVVAVRCEQYGPGGSWVYTVNVLQDGVAVVPSRRSGDDVWPTYEEAERQGYEVGQQIVARLVV